MKGDTIHQALGIKVDGKSVGKSAEMVAIEQAYLTNNYITFTWKILRSGWWGWWQAQMLMEMLGAGQSASLGRRPHCQVAEFRSFLSPLGPWVRC